MDPLVRENRDFHDFRTIVDKFNRNLILMQKPMLAARLKDLSDLRFPCLLTPKFDGIRCVKVGGKALTRAFKPVPNHHVRELIEATLPDGVDGELILGTDYSDTQSGIMRRDGKPDFRYCIFDMESEAPYGERVKQLTFDPPWVENVLPTLCFNVDEFKRYEDWCLAKGYEGVMSRSVDGPYKNGRSTLREQYLLKYKRVADGEATIIGFEEQMENCNPIVYNVFGRAKRPGGAEGKEPKDTLGSVTCIDMATGQQINLGSGFSDVLRKEIWENQDAYLGKVCHYRYQEVGIKEKPRFPRFVRFRDAAAGE